MRLLVTGSAGFIGSYAAAAAKTRGWKVIGIDVRDPGSPLDARDLRGLWGADVVLHLGAFSSNAAFPESLAANYANNVDGMLNVAQLCHQHSARLVYASSSAVYGSCGDYCEDEDNRENDPLRMYDELASHYGKSKLINEMMAESYRSAYDLSALGLRIFNAYGTGDELKRHPSPIALMQRAKLAGKPWVCYGHGTQAKDFVHISDVVEIIMRLIESDATGIVNVGTGVATSFNRLAELIGVPLEYARVPNPESYQYFTRADTARLLSIVGPYKFKSVEEGLTC
jgi:nucleoside-diphosphate-sugar epimerase